MQTPYLVNELAANRQAEIARRASQIARYRSADVEPRESLRHRAGRVLVGLGRRIAAEDL